MACVGPTNIRREREKIAQDPGAKSPATDPGPQFFKHRSHHTFRKPDFRRLGGPYVGPDPRKTTAVARLFDGKTAKYEGRKWKPNLGPPAPCAPCARFAAAAKQALNYSFPSSARASGPGMGGPIAGCPNLRAPRPSRSSNSKRQNGQFAPALRLAKNGPPGARGPGKNSSRPHGNREWISQRGRISNIGPEGPGPVPTDLEKEPAFPGLRPNCPPGAFQG